MNIRSLKFIFSYGLIITLLGACASQKYSKLAKAIELSSGPNETKRHFSGILIYDPISGDTLYSKNSKKYFTPASNTKIFTLYTALKILPERIPALKYAIKNDTLYIEGTGDPTAFHPYFQDSTAFNFLKGYSNISLYSGNFADTKFGPGWAWEDYDWYYAPERSALPLYGNVISVHNAGSLSVQPAYFRDSVQQTAHSRNREIDRNLFYFQSSRTDSIEIPYRTTEMLTKSLLEHSLGIEIANEQKAFSESKGILSGIPSDSLYTRMMHLSDNFLAEQMLVLSSSVLSDTLSTEKARDHILENYLSELRQAPRWVDGSGLSRYNLFTPESIVHVLHKMYLEIPRERLLNFFPAGGVSGTLVDWYPGDPKPYIYAKTGTLGNNHCLSGYLITKSGKILIFSFMNNHFRISNNEIKMQMQRIFEWVRDNY